MTVEVEQLSKRERRRMRNQGVLDCNEPTGKFPSKFSLRPFKPNNKQLNVIRLFNAGKHLALTGCAGTGKSYLAIRMALHAVEREEFNNVQIIRSIVSSRDPGFLPGTKDKKIEPFEMPYRSICAELYGRGDSYPILKEKGVVNFECTSFMRGTTLRGAVVILDEAQNCTFQELDTIVTRLGEGSRLILIGDSEQTDLPFNESGFKKMLGLLGATRNVSMMNFEIEDIVRSGFVLDYLTAKYSKRYTS